MLKRILSLIPPEEQSHLSRVAASVLLCGLLDVAGLAALFPILLKVLNPDSGKFIISFICLGVLGFILLKNGLITYLSRYQTRYLMRLYKKLSLQLFCSYYDRGLLFLKKKSSVQLGYEVNFMCYAFALNILKSLLIMLTEGTLALVLLLGLLIWEFQTGIILIVGFAPVFYVYVKVVKKRMRRYGEEEMEARKEQSRTVVEAFRGFCELEINQAFPTLMQHFETGLDTISHCRVRVETVQRLPQFMGEIAIILGLSILLLSSSGNLTLVGGVFAVAAFRLIPAVRGLMTGWTTLQTYTFCLDVLEEGLEMPTTKHLQHEQPGLCFERQIRMEDIQFSYPDGNEQILERFNCTILKGERIGIKGCSGSGKSTLFNIMLGFFPLEKGKIWIDHTLLSPDILPAWHKLVGYVPQDVFIMRGSLAQNIILDDGDYDAGKLWKILEQVKLKEWAENLPQGLDTELGEYGSRISGGQKQRIGIARALYKDAQILFFDEATSALDNETEKEINKAIEELSESRKELTLLVIAHRESSLAFCNRIIDLDKR